MRLTHTQAVGLMVANAAMWSIAGVVTRQLESARSFEVTFWRSLFTVVALLVILPLLQGRGVFQKMRSAGPILWISGLCWATMFTAFMVALTLSSVGNVLVTLALVNEKHTAGRSARARQTSPSGAGRSSSPRSATW